MMNSCYLSGDISVVMYGEEMQHECRDLAFIIEKAKVKGNEKVRISLFACSCKYMLYFFLAQRILGLSEMRQYGILGCEVRNGGVGIAKMLLHIHLSEADQSRKCQIDYFRQIQGTLNDT